MVASQPDRARLIARLTALAASKNVSPRRVLLEALDAGLGRLERNGLKLAPGRGAKAASVRRISHSTHAPIQPPPSDPTGVVDELAREWLRDDLRGTNIGRGLSWDKLPADSVLRIEYRRLAAEALRAHGEPVR